MTAAWQETSIPFGTSQIALKIYDQPSAQPVIALHGWRDNCATFDRLAPLLMNTKLIAVDLPGHGHSSPRHREASYYIWSYLTDVLAVADSLQLASFTLLGHSMGGAVAALFAAVFPERVKNLILLDAVGPLATPASDAPAQLLRSLEQMQALKPGHHRYYPDFMSAVEARADRGVSLEAAAILGHRGIVQDQRGFYWNLDPRLTKTNPLSLTEEHTAAFIRKIICNVLLVSARQFWVKKREWFELRRSYFQKLETHELNGNHHQHLDDQVEEVAGLINRFLAAQTHEA